MGKCFFLDDGLGVTKANKCAEVNEDQSFKQVNLTAAQRSRWVEVMRDPSHICVLLAYLSLAFFLIEKRTVEATGLRPQRCR